MAEAKLVIRAHNDRDHETLDSLFRWLILDATLSRYCKVTSETVARRPGEMGGAIDLISAVFAGVGAMAGVGSLLVAYRSWRDSRPDVPMLSIEGNGVTVYLEGSSDQEVQQAVFAILFEIPDENSTSSI